MDNINVHLTHWWYSTHARAWVYFMIHLRTMCVCDRDNAFPRGYFLGWIYFWRQIDDGDRRFVRLSGVDIQL